jgi:hypothetical protein
MAVLSRHRLAPGAVAAVAPRKGEPGFPGGKHQLALEAARRNAEDIRGYLNALPSDSPSWYHIIPLPGERTGLSHCRILGVCA